MNCGKVRKILVGVGLSRRELPVQVRAHLEACARCRRSARLHDEMLRTLEDLSRTPVQVDVLSRVMTEVRRTRPEPAAGLDRPGRWLVAASVLGLAAQGAWLLWLLLAHGRAGGALRSASTGWDLISSAARSLGGAAVFLFDLTRDLLGAVVLPLAESLQPLLPLWIAAATVGFVLLIALGAGAVRMAPRLAEGATP